MRPSWFRCNYHVTPGRPTADRLTQLLPPRRSTADNVARFIVAVMLLGGALVKAIAAPDVLDLPTLMIAGLITVALAGGGQRLRRAMPITAHTARS